MVTAELEHSFVVQSLRIRLAGEPAEIGPCAVDLVYDLDGSVAYLAMDAHAEVALWRRALGEGQHQAPRPEGAAAETTKAARATLSLRPAALEALTAARPSPTEPLRIFDAADGLARDLARWEIAGVDWSGEA
ncbi:MAG: hypothetical protein CSA66_01210 [Proteobacteria bacterium]|nr:MAG: hypothetical protein CSA66_01210 [Pseudomonadota bacterium]